MQSRIGFLLARHIFLPARHVSEHGALGRPPDFPSVTGCRASGRPAPGAGSAVVRRRPVLEGTVVEGHRDAHRHRGPVFEGRHRLHGTPPAAKPPPMPVADRGICARAAPSTLWHSSLPTTTSRVSRITRQGTPLSHDGIRPVQELDVLQVDVRVVAVLGHELPRAVAAQEKATYSTKGARSAPDMFWSSCCCLSLMVGSTGKVDNDLFFSVRSPCVSRVPRPADAAAASWRSARQAARRRTSRSTRGSCRPTACMLWMS